MLKKISFLFGCILLLTISVGCCSHILNSNHATTSLVNHLNESSVSLVYKDLYGDYDSYCSGSWIGPHHIVTARHCVKEGSDVKLDSIIYFQTIKHYSGDWPTNGAAEAHKAKIVAEGGPDIDLAILEVEQVIEHKTLTILKGDIPQGLNIYVTGHTRGLLYTHMPGFVAGIRNMKINSGKSRYVIHAIAPGYGGNSGGGMVTENGELVAVNVFIITSMPGHLFGVHKDVLLTLIKDNKIKLNYP